jgi:hypothetical protein
MADKEKRFAGLDPDQPFAFMDFGEMLVDDPELGLCSVDTTLPPSKQALKPVKK